MTEKVSIITPIYNCRQFILDTIDSVLDQTYKNWELILVDDCSTDGSMELIRQHTQDSRIRIHQLTTNSGAAVARNTAITASTGRYIAFLDSDDVWEKNKLKRQIEFMAANNYPFTFTSYERVDQNNQSIDVINAPSRVNYRTLLKSNVIGCFTVIYDSKIFGKAEMPLIRKRQDFGLWLKLLKTVPYAYGMPERLGYYRIRPDSVSSNKWSAAKYNWILYRKIEKLNLFESIYFFCHYAIGGLLKNIGFKKKP